MEPYQISLKRYPGHERASPLTELNGIPTTGSQRQVGRGRHTDGGKSCFALLHLLKLITKTPLFFYNQGCSEPRPICLLLSGRQEGAGTLTEAKQHDLGSFALMPVFSQCCWGDHQTNHQNPPLLLHLRIIGSTFCLLALRRQVGRDTD